MRRVLVVDDDRATRETCDAALRNAGYAVDLADSGNAAMAALSSGTRPHGLILDLKLGDMTGYDLLRWMRAQALVVPTAVVTAFRVEFDPDEAIVLGAIAYADQPLTLDDILALADSLTAPPTPNDNPQRLHARVLAGHPGALDCLALVVLKALPQRLARAFPRVPSDFTVDAATDACLEYGAHPARFDASRSSLIDYVYLIARRNLLDRVRAESARSARETRYTREQSALLPADIPVRRSDLCPWTALSTVIHRLEGASSRGSMARRSR